MSDNSDGSDPLLRAETSLQAQLFDKLWSAMGLGVSPACLASFRPSKEFEADELSGSTAPWPSRGVQISLRILCCWDFSNDITLSKNDSIWTLPYSAESPLSIRTVASKASSIEPFTAQLERYQRSDLASARLELALFRYRKHTQVSIG